MSPSGSTLRRWQQESEFFDKHAAEAAVRMEAMDPMAIARFGSTRLRKRFSKEFRFRLMGDLRGKSVLDLGCGEGEDSVLMASLGAHVTGIDISPKSIEVAAERARLSGVGSRTTFRCAPAETLQAEGVTFDIIWGKAILHHLIPDLRKILSTLCRLCTSQTLVIFNEPVNLCPLLRRVRFMVPLHTDATPGERPLERAELDLLGEYFAPMQLQFFRMAGRLERLLLPDGAYERSNILCRAASNSLALFDYALLKAPGMLSLASEAVIYGHLRLPHKAGNKTEAELVLSGA